jgi:cytochrome P450
LIRSVWALRRAAADPIAFLQNLAQHGDVVPFSIGRRRAFLLNHPSFVEDVLLTQQDKFAKGPAFARAGRLLGSGLLTAEGALHRGRRRLAQPAFHRARMDRHAAAIVAHGVRERDSWRAGAPIDVAARIATVTFGIVGETIFGADLAAHAPAVREAVAAATASGDSLISLIAPVRRVDRARARLEDVIDRMIMVRLKADPTETDTDADDLLSLLLEAETGNAPSQQLRDDVLTILLAGHDTIASALTWTWTLLSNHPAVDEALAREVAAIAEGRPLVASDVPRLVFTRAVLAESLRLRPPAWVLARLALAPYTAGTTLIPEGSLVIMSQYLIHRDPRWFDDPLAFRPERWLAPPPASRPKLAYFPFGAGPRSCIGEPFAWLEGTLLLATTAQRWRLKMQEAPEDPAPQVTLRPRGPVMMIPERRQT